MNNEYNRAIATTDCQIFYFLNAFHKHANNWNNEHDVGYCLLRFLCIDIIKQSSYDSV